MQDFPALKSCLISMAPVVVVSGAVGTALAGPRGLLGALLAVVTVMFFFVASAAASSGMASRHGPRAGDMVMVICYPIKIIALGALALVCRDIQAFDGRTFGATAIAAVLVWSVAMTWVMTRNRMLYVRP